MFSFFLINSFNFLLQIVLGYNLFQLKFLTFKGIVAKIGMNEKGLGVALNFLDCYESSELVNIPVHMMLRKVLGIYIAKEF